MMKKFLAISMVVLTVLLAVSCKSKPATQEQVNDAFQKVYNKYKGDLILDGASTYTVVKGDTLAQIANAKYGKGNGIYFPLIMLASSEVVLDPDLIEPGMKLTIPVLDKNLEDAAAKAHVKNFLNEVAKVYDTKDREKDAEALRAKAKEL
jgi:LysM repeat protein